MVTELTEAERAALARVTEALIPGAAAPAGLPPGVADRVRGALATLGDADLDTALPALIASGSADAQALLLVISAAHYADGDVRAAIGYPGPQAIPLPPLPDPADAELEDALARVRERGPIYRDA